MRAYISLPLEDAKLLSRRRSATVKAERSGESEKQEAGQAGL